MTGIVLGFFISEIWYQKKEKVSYMSANLETYLPLATNSAHFKIKNPVTSYRVPILMYHYVEYVKDARDTIRKSLDIVPAIFEQQIVTFKDKGYMFITAGELGDYITGNGTIPEKPVLLTFDDGYRDLYTDVFPIIKKYQVRITVYMVSSFLDKPNYLFKWQLQEMVNSGLVELGAHTVHHISLKEKSSKVDQDEITGSKKELEDIFHIPIVSFAYPYGAYDEQAIRSVKQSGYKTAVTTMLGDIIDSKNPYVIPRIRPGNKTGDTLIQYIQSL